VEGGKAEGRQGGEKSEAERSMRLGTRAGSWVQGRTRSKSAGRDVMMTAPLLGADRWWW
jgi:hypothetical protein